MYYQKETIAAIATPIGLGGIGIIRISGDNAENIAHGIFKPKQPVKSFKSFRLYLGHIIDPDSHLPIDEVLLSIMRAPFSYTRENVVEINSHSGHLILFNILNLVLQSGARLAKPGEFTLRAFLNGRIDLTQAEAIIDLINAKGDMSVRLAANQLGGRFCREIKEVRDKIVEMLSQIEASIDFPDEESIITNRSQLSDSINKDVIGPLQEFISAHSQGKIWQEGSMVVITGRVNVGKSSILNRFLNEERAIVTPIPGTTRDVLEYMVNVNGLPLRFIDTAGMRKIKGKIEKKGVELAKIQISSADLILLVIDINRRLNQYDFNLLERVNRKNTIVVINKIDLPEKLSEKKINDLFKDFPKVYISALTGEGFQDLNKAIFDKIMGDKKDISPAAIIPNLRQKTLLEKAAGFLKNALENLANGFPLELVATDLLEAAHSIDEVTGDKTNEEVLDTIFSRFCVGK